MRSVLLGLAAAFVTATGTAALAETVTMRISHQVPPAHHLVRMLEVFAEEAKAQSNGDIKVELLGASSAFKPAENHPAVARGSIEGALSVNFQWGNTIPEMNVVVIPYQFGELERIKKFPGSDAARVLEDKLLEKGVRNLAWFYITRQAIYTSSAKPIDKLEDFQGLKIRGFNKMADEALKAVGAAPSAMAGDEVYQALQTGVLDAGVTDVSAAYSRKYYEVQKYGTVTPALTVYFHLYVNPAWYDGLSDAHKQALQAAAKKAEEAAIGITEKTAEDSVAKLREKGMQLIVHDEAQAKVWEQAMQKPVLDAFLAAAPKDGPRLIELLNKL